MQFIGFGDGSDGDLHITTNTEEVAIASICSGTAGTAVLTVDASLGFAANQIVTIWQTRGDGGAGAIPGTWERAQVLSYVGTTLTLRTNLVNTYTTGGSINRAQVKVCKQYSSVTIDVGCSYSPQYWDGNKYGIMDFLCSGIFINNGTLLGTGRGFRGGAPGGDDLAFSGEGT